MEVLRPVLSTSRRGAFNAVEKKQLKQILGHIFWLKICNLESEIKKNKEHFFSIKLNGSERSSTRAAQNWSQNMCSVSSFARRVQTIKRARDLPYKTEISHTKREFY